MLIDKHKESFGTWELIISYHFVVEDQERKAIRGLLQLLRNVDKAVIVHGLVRIYIGGMPLPIYGILMDCLDSIYEVGILTNRTT